MGIILENLKSSPLYSEELGIALAKGTDGELFKWFLASILFGARISETIAKNTLGAFARHGLLTPRSILDAGRDFLVDPIMREGGYVRYDGRKSAQILRNCEQLMADHRGSLTRLHASARDGRDLEEKLLNFFGIGPVTVNIFLRELRPVWLHADPAPLPIVEELAESLGLDFAAYDRKSMVFARIEAGLIRNRKSLLKPPRSGNSPAAAQCSGMPPAISRLGSNVIRQSSHLQEWLAHLSQEIRQVVSVVVGAAIPIGCTNCPLRLHAVHTACEVGCEPHQLNKIAAYPEPANPFLFPWQQVTGQDGRADMDF